MTADTVGILTLPLEGLEDLADVIRHTNMRVDPTFIGNWPVFGADVPPVEEWTSEQKYRLKEIDDRIVRTLGS